MEALAASATGRFASSPVRGAAGMLLVLSLALLARESHSQANFGGDAVKAAYLYRFTQYVEWPAVPKSAFVIAVMDAPSVAEELAKLLSAHSILNVPVRVRSVHATSEIADAAMLYVGAEPAERLRSVISAVASRPLLVVTDSQEGLSLGSTINFLNIDKHIRFEVSTTAAERAKLHVSAELLAVAARVDQRGAR